MIRYWPDHYFTKILEFKTATSSCALELLAWQGVEFPVSPINLRRRPYNTLTLQPATSSCVLELLNLSYLPPHYRFDAHNNVVHARLLQGIFSRKPVFLDGLTVTNLKLEIC